MNIPLVNPHAQSTVNVRELVTPARRALLAGRGLRGSPGVARIRLPRRRGAGPGGQGGRGDAARRPARRRRGRSRQPGLPAGARREGDRNLVPSRARPSRRADAHPGAPSRPRRRIAAPQPQRAAPRRGAVRARARADERAAAPRGQRSLGDGGPRLARARLSRPPLRPADARRAREPGRDRARRPKGLAGRLVTRGALHIGVVGAIDEARAARLRRRGVRRSAGERRTHAPSPKRRSRASAASRSSISTCRRSTIRFGRPAVARDDPDYIASIVLAHVLGGGTGLSSRLFREVQGKARPRLFGFGLDRRRSTTPAISMAAPPPRTSAPTNRSTSSAPKFSTWRAAASPRTNWRRARNT